MLDYIYSDAIDIKNLIDAFPLQVRKWGYSLNQEARKRKYKDCVCAFDIETTNIDEIDQSVMYIWQMQINAITIIGRYWEEFRSLLEDIAACLKGTEFLVIYVHNLSFEFQYLSSVFRDSIDNVFCTDARKVLKFDVLGHIEFRCSYLHSNMSLAEYTKKMGVKDYKLKGDVFDYSKKRYPWDDFEAYSNYEKRYVINDVKGLVQALKIDMEIMGDNLYSIPLTSTGYSRRDAKKVLGPAKKYIQKILPDLSLLKELIYGFRGGNTHANRYFTGHLMNADITHAVDISSSYPTQIVNHKFPMGKWHSVTNTDFDRIWTFIQKGYYAYFMEVMLTDVRLKDEFWGCPYIPKAKCKYVDHGIYDNGRVLEASALIMNITDIDLRILLSEYDFNIDILRAWKSKYNYLPDAYRDLVKGYFEQKTSLKGIEGQEVYYQKSKALLNALYGMMCQNPLKPEIKYIDGDFIEQEMDEEKRMREYYNTAFLSYSWGVWVTSYARYQLEQGIRYICDSGGEFIYTDTDSIKYTGDVDLTGLNKALMQQSIKNGAFASDKHGTVHYMGVWEPEDDMTEFITLGAKKYGYRTLDGKLHLTIAGVNKVKGADEIEASGGLENFRIGYIFSTAGGNEITYNDTDYGPYEVDGHQIYITKNIVIKDSFYTLGITNEYAELLYLLGENIS